MRVVGGRRWRLLHAARLKRECRRAAARRRHPRQLEREWRAVCARLLPLLQLLWLWLWLWWWLGLFAQNIVQRLGPALVLFARRTAQLHAPRWQMWCPDVEAQLAVVACPPLIASPQLQRALAMPAQLLRP